MKIRVCFTVEVPQGDLENLRILAGGVETSKEAAEFVRGDAADYTVQYLTDNGVRAKEVW